MVAVLGIMDDTHTHLRFFTSAPTLRLFTDAGFKIERMASVHLSVDGVDEIDDVRVNSALRNVVEPLLRDQAQMCFNTW